MSRRFVEVALPPPLSRQLTYGVPAELHDVIEAGSVVLVPVQQRLVTGFVVADADPAAAGRPPERIRDLIQVVDTATPPERKSWPRHGLTAVVATVVTFILLVIGLLIRANFRRSLQSLAADPG